MDTSYKHVRNTDKEIKLDYYNIIMYTKDRMNNLSMNHYRIVDDKVYLKNNILLDSGLEATNFPYFDEGIVVVNANQIYNYKEAKLSPFKFDFIANKDYQFNLDFYRKYFDSDKIANRIDTYVKKCAKPIAFKKIKIDEDVIPTFVYLEKNGEFIDNVNYFVNDKLYVWPYKSDNGFFMNYLKDESKEKQFVKKIGEVSNDRR